MQNKAKLLLSALIIFGCLGLAAFLLLRNLDTAKKGNLTAPPALHLVEIHHPFGYVDFEWAAPGDLLPLRTRSMWNFVLYKYQGERVLSWDIQARVITINGGVVGLDLRRLSQAAALNLLRQHRRAGPLFLWIGKQRVLGKGVIILQEQTPTQLLCTLDDCGFGINLRYPLRYSPRAMQGVALTNCSKQPGSLARRRILSALYPGDGILEWDNWSWKKLATQPNLRFLTKPGLTVSEADLGLLRLKRAEVRAYIKKAKSSSAQLAIQKDLGTVKFYLEELSKRALNGPPSKAWPESHQEGFVHLHRAGPAGLRRLQILNVGGLLAPKDIAFITRLPHLRVLRLLGLPYLNRKEFDQLTRGATSLQELYMPQVLPDSRSVIYLRRLRELRILDMSGARDEALRQIGRLKKLQRLVLWGEPNQISDKGLVHLQGLCQLRQLIISTTGRLSHLASLHNLRLLQWSSPHMDIRSLRGLRRLQQLDLGVHRTLGHQGLIHLASLKQLRRLSLRVGDAGLSHLRALTNLRSLTLYFAQFSPVGLRHFRAMRKLRFLGLRWMNVAGPEMAELSQLDRLQAISVAGLSRDAQKHLLRFKSLRFVYIRSAEDRARVQRWLKKRRSEIVVW